MASTRAAVFLALLSAAASSQAALLRAAASAADAAGQFGYGYGPNPGTSNPKWMARVPNTTPVSKLSVPGTHDTMSLYGGVFTQTQAMRLATQLAAGIRALDIRCRHVSNRFLIYHGPIYENANFDTVLWTVRRFLKANPTETILMRVKEEYDADQTTRSFPATFLWYQARYPGLFWTGVSANPTMAQVRGKIVLLRNFLGAKVGLDYSSFAIQDEYQLATPLDLYKKWLLVKGQLARASLDKTSQTIYVNFLSGSGFAAWPYFVASGRETPTGKQLLTGLKTPLAALLYPDFPRVDCVGGSCSIAFQGTNVLTAARLQKYGRVGIVFADFPGRQLIAGIIARNFAK